MENLDIVDSGSSNLATGIAQSLLFTGLAAAVAVTGYKTYKHFKPGVAEIEIVEINTPTPKKSTPKKTA